jgi:hypothetical protein
VLWVNLYWVRLCSPAWASRCMDTIAVRCDDSSLACSLTKRCSSAWCSISSASRADLGAPPVDHVLLYSASCTLKAAAETCSDPPPPVTSHPPLFCAASHDVAAQVVTHLWKAEFEKQGVNHIFGFKG